MKKGNASWKPASLNEFTNKEDGFRYRQMRKDPENLYKKEVEGWEIVSGVQGSNTKSVDPNRIDLPAQMTSVQEGRDWILGRIPEELALERDKYIDNENERRVAGLTAHVKKENAKSGAGTHGEITISSRKRTQTFE